MCTCMIWISLERGCRKATIKRKERWDLDLDSRINKKSGILKTAVKVVFNLKRKY